MHGWGYSGRHRKSHCAITRHCWHRHLFSNSFNTSAVKWRTEWFICSMRTCHQLCRPTLWQSWPTLNPPYGEVLPRVVQHGCAFHFRQAVWRNIQAIGLQVPYPTDDRVHRICWNFAIPACRWNSPGLQGSQTGSTGQRTCCALFHSVCAGVNKYSPTDLSVMKCVAWQRNCWSAR